MHELQSGGRRTNFYPATSTYAIYTMATVYYAMYYIKSCDTDRTFVAAAHAQYSLLLSIFEVFTCA